MRYNLLDSKDNLSTLLSVINENGGKVVFLSSNAFIVSSILLDLKNHFLAGGALHLYDWSGELNLNVISDRHVAVLCFPAEVSRISHPNVTSDFKVAVVQGSSSDFSCEIEMHDYKEYFVDSDVNTAKNEVAASSAVSYTSDIVQAMKTNNVIFVQDLNENVIELIELSLQDKSELLLLNTITSDYAEECGIVVLTAAAPEADTELRMDVVNSICTNLRNGCTFVCNASWVPVFFELTSTELDLSISSTIIYNTADFGPMGNTALYGKPEE